MKLRYHNLSYCIADEQSLSMTYSIIPLVHYGCSFPELEPFLVAAIEKGEIHPREVGLLYDNYYRKQPTLDKCKIRPSIEGIFYLNRFCNYQKYRCSPEKANALRSQYYIVPLEVDAKKEAFEKKYGFKLFWGFWSCM